MQEHNEIILIASDFYKTLNDFSEKVKQGDYKKIPYEDFCSLKKINCGIIRIARVLNYIYITHSYNEGFSSIYDVKTNDGSFGEYLFDTFFKRKDNDMPPKDSETEYQYYYDWNACKGGTHDTYSDDSITSNGNINCFPSEQLRHDTNTDTNIRLGGVFDGSGYADYTKPYEENPIAHESDLTNMKQNLEAEMNRISTESKENLIEINQKIRDLDIQYNGLQDDINELIGHRIFETIDYYVDDHPAIAEIKDYLYTLMEYIPKEKLKEVFDKNNKNIVNVRKENEMNTNKMFNFEFGPVSDSVRMSPYGLAIRNAGGKYVSYDAKTGSMMDVDILNFEGNKFMYKMPVAVKDIAVGDVVVHNHKPMFVTSVNDKISVVDIYNGEEKTILISRSPFGFDFVTKVVSLMNFGDANAENPFGNMWPLMLMGDGTDMKDVMMMSFLANGCSSNMFSNPMALMAMAYDDKDMKDMIPLLMMGQFMAPAPTPIKQHNCGCPNHSNEENYG